MDLKNKLSEYMAKAKGFCSSLGVKCAPALEKGRVIWNNIRVWLGKAKDWILRTARFLMDRFKWIAGHAAVLALKIRKWVRKNTASFRGWWAQWNGRKWLEARGAQIRQWGVAMKDKFSSPREQEMEAAESAEIQPVHVEAPVVRTVRQQDPPVEKIPVRENRKPPRKPLVDPESTAGKILDVICTIGRCIRKIFIWIFKLRRFIMAAPVVYFAVKLAIQNANRLPEKVGMDIQASGEFARMVSRNSAVLGPLALTGFCLVLLFCSKKTLLPWMISLFTLILPVLIWMTNYYA